MLIAVLASLASAALNASSSVLERLALPDTGRKLLSHSQAWLSFMSKKFMSGLLLQIIAFGMQALALDHAPLIVVEPLLTIDLIFLLLLLRVGLKTTIKRRDWLAALLMIGGMSGLFAAARPVGGHLQYALLPWLLAIILSVVVICLGLLLVKSSDSPRVRAAAAALAGAVSFALNAAFTKLALNQLNQSGAVAVFTSWPLYALLLSGLTSIYLMQTAYSTGPLAVSQPIMEVAEPTISILIGLLIFGDHVNHQAGALLGQIISIMVVIGGIIRLASSPQIQQAAQPPSPK